MKFSVSKHRPKRAEISNSHGSLPIKYFRNMNLLLIVKSATNKQITSTKWKEKEKKKKERDRKKTTTLSYNNVK